MALIISFTDKSRKGASDLMKRLLIFTVFVFVTTGFLKAQHQEISEKPEMYRGRKVESTDTVSLLSAFKRGNFNGHFRYFFMSTQNEKGLTDYYANAAGGGLRYETARFHGFQFALSGFYIFNIGSSDFTKADTTTGQYNRYEIGLFDLQDPANKTDIDRLEEFYLKYNYKTSNIIFGRQIINTPFINLQDGRMRPTGVEGVWFEINELKKTKLEGGWLYAIAPRSTTKWFGIDESMGVYPAGIHTDGTKSQYAGNMNSKGVFVLGVHYQLNEKIRLQGWDFLVDNIFNTAMLQTDIVLPLKTGSKILLSAQVISQQAVNHGGHADATKAYFEKAGSALSFGAKAGWDNTNLETSVNYNRITKQGRYLMPREWGRDPFFTFLPRERNEGFGDVHAIAAKVNYKIPKARLKASMAVGYYHLPDVKNYKLNKYGLPSYYQLNGDIRYSFTGLLKGLEAQLLVSGKINDGETYNNQRYTFNKVNMIQYNFVLNYYF
ncbi:MAG: outer membrane porin, OprD family [Chitinophagaceae bacterium]|nr:outer membrane porin, OprD family [Chitinophagaceae bacterium]